jgi:hypothetical protein
MKIAAFVVISSTLFLASCGSKEGDNNSNNSSNNDELSKIGNLISGTSWTLNKIVDNSKNNVANAKKTILSFDKNKNVLDITNSNGNVSICSIKTGGQYSIIKSSNPNEYLVQDPNPNCSGISSGGVRFIPSMAIITIDNNSNISIKRQTFQNLSISNGKVDPSVILTETYTKN